MGSGFVSEECKTTNAVLLCIVPLNRDSKGRKLEVEGNLSLGSSSFFGAERSSVLQLTLFQNQLTNLFKYCSDAYEDMTLCLPLEKMGHTTTKNTGLYK